jgi:hypothetical protein
MKITMKVAIKLLVFVSLIFQQAIAQKKLKEKDMSAYLMVYFKDETHGLYMALSKDGYSFTDINNGKPIMSGDTIALQKGIRDPHIMRGPDGAFYLAMTDLHLFAEKAGFRSTQWERDKSYGWGNNRSMVLMKSWDLINWSHNIVRVDQAFPGLDSIGCAWAPETIYDKDKKKMMVYFTMRFKNGKNKIYYSYADNDFTKLETAPKLLFEYPKDISYIDADITKVGKKYHLFYVPHDGTPGIKQVVSNSLSEGYVYDPKYYDPEPKACEAPTVFKRIGEEKSVLVYDIYGITPHNFGFSETTDFVNFKDIGHFNEGIMKSTNFSSPKHGAVVHLTKKEAEVLAKKWNFTAWF